MATSIALTSSLSAASVEVAPTVTPGPCLEDTPYRAEVTVHNLAGREGNIRVQIYSDIADEWLEKGAKLARVDTPATADVGGSQSVCIAVPAPGTFAFVAMHDRNGNGKADIFSEGFGFSNNPKLGLSKPDHAEVTIPIHDSVTTLDIELRYVFGAPKKKNKRNRRRRSR